MRLAVRQEHVYDDAPLRTLINRFCTLADLADAVIPVHVVTTDLDDGVARWWSRWPCEELLYASACLPGLLPPAELDGHRHVDGGVLEPIPVQRAVDLDATTIYVLGEGDLSAPPAGRRTALQVLLRSFAISRYTRLPDSTALAHPGQQVIVLRGASTAGLDIRDFSQTSRLIAESYELTRAHLSEGDDTATEPFLAHRGVWDAPRAGMPDGSKVAPENSLPRLSPTSMASGREVTRRSPASRPGSVRSSVEDRVSR